MPGREHFIPQLIQRPFACDVSGDQYLVYQFRRGRPGFKLSTVNSAVVNDFYGEGADSVDWMFTDREGDQATLIRELRAGKPAEERKPQIDEMIVLMTARSRNIRLVLSDLGRRSFDTFERALASEEGRRTLVDVLTKWGAKELVTQGLTPGSPGFDLGIRMMRSAFITPLVETGLVDRVYAALRSRIGNFDGVMQVAHVNALRRLSEASVITRVGLAPLRWRVETPSDRPMILGDAGPMARFADADTLMRLYQGGPSLGAVFYPLSPHELLVGAPEDSAVVIPSAEELNIAMAEVSCEFFIASRSTESEAGYAGRLDLRASPINETDEEKMRRAMLEALGTLE